LLVQTNFRGIFRYVSSSGTTDERLGFSSRETTSKGCPMGTIIPFLRDGIGLRDSVFEPHEIRAMSTALDQVCEALKLQNDVFAKQVMAARIIDLVRCGERSPTRLRDRVLHEASLSEHALDVQPASEQASKAANP
jgi:hypothetical protein